MPPRYEVSLACLVSGPDQRAALDDERRSMLGRERNGVFFGD